MPRCRDEANARHNHAWCVNGDCFIGRPGDPRLAVPIDRRRSCAFVRRDIQRRLREFVDATHVIHMPVGQDEIGDVGRGYTQHSQLRRWILHVCIIDEPTKRAEAVCETDTQRICEIITVEARIDEDTPVAGFNIIARYTNAPPVGVDFEQPIIENR